MDDPIRPRSQALDQALDMVEAACREAGIESIEIAPKGGSVMVWRYGIGRDGATLVEAFTTSLAQKLEWP